VKAMSAALTVCAWFLVVSVVLAQNGKTEKLSVVAGPKYDRASTRNYKRRPKNAESCESHCRTIRRLLPPGRLSSSSIARNATGRC